MFYIASFLTNSSDLKNYRANLVCSMCRVNRQQIVNFMTPLKKSSSLLPGID